VLHPDDDDGEPFVLARVNDNKVLLVGWVYGHEGKQPHFWTAPSKLHPDWLAFFVPNDRLHDMRELPDRLGMS
jgi:hypothetical protein